MCACALELFFHALPANSPVQNRTSLLHVIRFCSAPPPPKTKLGCPSTQGRPVFFFLSEAASSRSPQLCFGGRGAWWRRVCAYKGKFYFARGCWFGVHRFCTLCVPRAEGEAQNLRAVPAAQRRSSTLLDSVPRMKLSACSHSCTQCRRSDSILVLTPQGRHA
jgi:hypothetical protein